VTEQVSGAENGAERQRNQHSAVYYSFTCSVKLHFPLIPFAIKA